jgi:membrane associated rhomboid family serine protease
MIPLRDVIPSRTTPFITVTLIVINAIVFAYEFLLDGCRTDSGIIVTGICSPVAAALQAGMTTDDFLVSFGLIPAQFSWLTVLTSMFLHGGLLHFAGNMLYLWIFGDNVEDRMGHGRFVVFYLLCGTTAALVQTLMVANGPSSLIPMVGASGAIAGVMGAYFVLYPHSRIVTLVPIFLFIQLIEIPAIFFLGFWFLIQFLSGVGSIATAVGQQPAGGVAFWAHVAGFAAGAGGVFLFRRPERQRVEWWNNR